MTKPTKPKDVEPKPTPNERPGAISRAVHKFVDKVTGHKEAPPVAPSLCSACGNLGIDRCVACGNLIAVSA